MEAEKMEEEGRSNAGFAKSGRR